MKLQFLGHACFLLDDGVHKVLTDPFLTGAGRPEWAAVSYTHLTLPTNSRV